MPKLRTSVAFDISIGAITGQSEAIDAISKGLERGVTDALTGSSLDKVQKDLSSAFSAAYVKGQVAGLKKQAIGLKKQYAKSLDSIKRQGLLLADYQKKIENSRVEAEKQSLQKQSEAVRKEIQELQSSLQNRIDLQNEATEKQVKLLDEQVQNSLKSSKVMSERAQAAGEGFASIVSKAMTMDNMDPAAFISGLGSSLAAAGPALGEMGAGMAAEGSGMVAMLGEAAVALGAAAGVLAGAAAAIGAVVAVFAAAYGQTKEMNKEILTGASGLDMMGDASGNLATSLKDVRQAAIETTNNFRVGTSDVIGYLTAVNRANVTFKEMRKTFGTMGTAQEAYVNTASTVIRQMQVFGASADDVGKELHFMVDGLGMGLESINDAFVTMFQGAKMSGLAVNDFFSSVNEATSGMARMNFRMEDTVSMLVAMEDILGEDMAKEMAKYTKKYKDMSTVDRMKTVMTSGSLGRKVLKAQAGAQSESFTRDIKNDPKAIGAMITAGLGKMGEKGFELDESKIASLTGAELGKYQNLLGGALGERLGELSETLRGSKKGATLGQQAGALGNLDRAGEMAMDMAGAFAVLGNQGMDSMEGLDRAAFESITGIQGEMFEAYQDIQRRVGARLEEEGKGTGAGGKATLSDVATAIASGQMLSDEDRKALIEAKESGMTEMEKVANQQLIETTSVSQILKNYIVTLLETMSGYLDTIITLLPQSWDTTKVDSSRKKAEAGRQLIQLSELKPILQGQLDDFVKRGGDTKSDEYQKLKARIASTDAAMEGLRKTQYTGSGDYSGNTGQQLLGAYDAPVDFDTIEKAGLSNKMLDYGTTEESFGMLPSGVKSFKGDAFSDPETIKKLLEYSGKTAEANVTTEKTNANMAIDAEKQTKLQKKLLKAIENQWSQKALADIAGATGLSPKDLSEALNEKEGGLTSLANASGSPLSEEVMAQIRFLEASRQEATGGEGYNDFIYQNGVATGIDNKDVVGAKPGGALSKLGLGGGSRVTNINVNGGNTSEVLRVVKQAVRTAE